jgi:hypothetical protein
MSSKSSKPTPPNREDYEAFAKNYTGILDPDRAYMAAATGDRRYSMRRDLYPGQSVEDLPSKEDLAKR